MDLLLYIVEFNKRYGQFKNRKSSSNITCYDILNCNEILATEKVNIFHYRIIIVDCNILSPECCLCQPHFITSSNVMKYSVDNCFFLIKPVVNLSNIQCKSIVFFEFGSNMQQINFSRNRISFVIIICSFYDALNNSKFVHNHGRKKTSLDTIKFIAIKLCLCGGNK